MGGYGVYVGSAFAMVFALLLIFMFSSLYQAKKIIKQLKNKLN